MRQATVDDSRLEIVGQVACAPSYSLFNSCSTKAACRSRSCLAAGMRGLQALPAASSWQQPAAAHVPGRLCVMPPAQDRRAAQACRP